jgi:[ribosomal protein S5]-alanine N-acetyltransferase
MTTLTTARLLLRPMVAADAADLMGVFGDPVVMRAFGRGPFTEAEMTRWVRRNLEHQDEHGYGLFTVVHRTSDRIIGDCGLERMQLDGVEEHELGYDLRSDHWGHGYATEAAQAVKTFALETLGVPRVVSLVRATNGASARVAERIGMTLERELGDADSRYALYVTG